MVNDTFYDKVKQTADFIKEKLDGAVPTYGVVLGSGLTNLVDAIKDKKYIDYADIPNFPIVTVVGHEGRLVYGKIGDSTVLAMQGRFHFYEGYTMKEVTYPFYVMKLLGVENLIVTNACGATNPDFEPGDLMLITDYINNMGTNPLIGANDERFGPRFPDMTECYNKELREIAKKEASKLGVKCQEGVYVAFTGPMYETAAEIKAVTRLGGDAVGMSTVPETIVANYLGMKVLGIGCITNMATGLQKEKHDHKRVLAIANKASEDLCKWVENIILANR